MCQFATTLFNTASFSPIRANNSSSSYNAEDIKAPSDASSGFYPTGMQADYALPFSLSGLWKRKADVLPPETLHQVCTSRTTLRA